MMMNYDKTKNVTEFSTSHPRLGFEWAGRLRHVQFGRVRGMSTRRGNVVFLSDILDEAFERMREKQASHSLGRTFFLLP